MNEITILVVDDEKDIRLSLEEILSEEGYRVLLAEGVKKAEELFSPAVDLAIVDIKLGEESGLDLLKKFKTERPALPVVMVTGQGTVALAAQAFKLGAHDFLEKPLRLVQIRACLRNALESVRLKQRLTEQALGPQARPVFAAAVMQQLYRQAQRLAGVREPALVLGPTGSGKDVVARMLHFEGPRAAGPFVATNAASLPVNLAEDELFGHEKGAFTGADRSREGCLEQASGGTLFLDEIGDLDVQIQAKLLRVLETGTFTRLGSNRPVRVDVRLVCATHKDLEALVQAGKFREDLWYRINAFPLRVPGLDERKEDIPALADHFLSLSAADLGVQKRFSENARRALQRRAYPGNVRELKHLVARLAVYTDGEIIDEPAVDRAGGPAAGPAGLAAATGITNYLSRDFKTAREQFEKDYLRELLGRHQGNITATAQAIGMAQSNLSRKLKELGIR